MRSSLKVLSLVLLVLSVSLVFILDDAFAITPAQPFLDFTGDFTYRDGSGGSPSVKYKLDLEDANITQVQYVDLSFDCDVPASCGGSGLDPVLGWVLTFDILSNENTGSSLTFTPDPIEISITDGANTYMTADLSDFTVDVNGAITRLNWNYDVVNLTNFNFMTGYDNSQYLTELYDHVVTSGGPVAMHLDFGFNTGCDTFGENCDFSRDATGTFDGKAVAPEPISSLLFIVGGATLAARRFRREKKIRPDLS